MSCPLDFQKAVKKYLEQSENQVCNLLLAVFTNVLKDPIPNVLKDPILLLAVFTNVLKDPILAGYRDGQHTLEIPHGVDRGLYRFR